MTDSFGTRLRRQRERRQTSLADIAAHTKIKASLFEALERDDVSHWPSGIFRRSFVRAYAQAIGADPDETVREFQQLFPDATDDQPASDAALKGAAGATDSDLSSTDRLSAAVAPPAPGGGLRLTLVETDMPFTGGRLLVDARRRWSAAAWDLGSLVAIALSAFVIVDAFWVPFAVTALCYYVGGVLFLGNSPGVCLFAPRAGMTVEGGQPQPARVTRPRNADVTAFRHHAAPVRSKRWKRLRT
jgi:transcriptional regulator with XRE-family HTH domain